MSKTVIVTHSKFGEGYVIGSRYNNFELRVQFSSTKRWVRFDELTDILGQLPEEEIPADTSTQKQSGTKPGHRIVPTAWAEEKFKPRRMIEAFRLGIVPDGAVEDFTYGRSNEIRGLKMWLMDPKQNTFAVIGNYGTGKSHLLQHTYAMALQHKFAVARVEIDPAESPFHKPKRVYAQLVRSLKYLAPDGSRLLGFRDLLKAGFAKGKLTDHRYFRHVANSIHDETVWEWIEAQTYHRVRPPDYGNYKIKQLPGLYDYGTAANIYCNLLSSLSHSAALAAGLKGLLLIFDESEAIEIKDYGYQAQRSENFLRALMLTASNDERLLYAYDASRAYGLDFCGFGPSVPFLYRNPSRMKILLAFTSLDWNYLYYDYYTDCRVTTKVPELEHALQIELEPLSKKARREIIGKIQQIYHQTYNGTVKTDITDEILNALQEKPDYNTRQMVKAVVEALDLVRFHPKSPLDDILW